MKRPLRNSFPLALTLGLLWAGPAPAQRSPEGVVTAVHGTATVARASVAEPAPLKFKDPVFVHDRIATGDRSLARLLLHGKAVVTARERSVLTITAGPGRATIEAASGKLALSVAKSLNAAGETIEIKARNALATVRGTVVVAEVRPGLVPDGSQDVTVFTVLRGVVDVAQLDPQTGRPTGRPLRLTALQAVHVIGTATPRTTTIAPQEGKRITDEFVVPLTHVPATNAAVSSQQVAPASIASILGRLTTSTFPATTTGQTGNSGPSGSSGPSSTSGPSGSADPSLTSGSSGSSGPSSTSSPSASVGPSLTSGSSGKSGPPFKSGWSRRK